MRPVLIDPQNNSDHVKFTEATECRAIYSFFHLIDIQVVKEVSLLP